jgi:hypothetical protein
LNKLFIAILGVTIFFVCSDVEAKVTYNQISKFSWVHEWKADVNSSQYLYEIHISGENVFSTSQRTKEGKVTTWLKFLTESNVQNKNLGYAVSYGREFPGGISAAHVLKRDVKGIEPIISPKWENNTCKILNILHVDGSISSVLIIRNLLNKNVNDDSAKKTPLALH